MEVPKASVMPLYVYGIWHRPDKRWIFGPAVATILKQRLLSETSSGEQTWQQHFNFVSLSTGFVQHQSKGTETRYDDSREGIYCEDVDPPTKDWGDRYIPWQDCEWIDLGKVYEFDWDDYRFWGGVDASNASGKPSW